ncbi:MAG: hypothetical protein EBS11_11190, partial [Janthinobacterium sp.]|nr:hypothetical protein [Janthinobacterium sp.]
MPVEGNVQADIAATDSSDDMPGPRLGVSYADQATIQAAGAGAAGNMPGGSMHQASQGMAGSSCMHVGDGGGMGGDRDGAGGGGGMGGDPDLGDRTDVPQADPCRRIAIAFDEALADQLVQFGPRPRARDRGVDQRESAQRAAIAHDAGVVAPVFGDVAGKPDPVAIALALDLVGIELDVHHAFLARGRRHAEFG